MANRFRNSSHKLRLFGVMIFHSLVTYISWYIKEILSMNVGKFGDWSIDVDDDYDLDYWQCLFI